MKKNRNYNHYCNRRNKPKKKLADINIAVYDDLGLDRVGKDLNLIYENISEADVRNLNISKTEKVLSQIEKSKCYHLTVMPLIMYGARLNTIFLEKYLAKVILAHPEYLYYLRPMGDTEYGLCGTD